MEPSCTRYGYPYRSHMGLIYIAICEVDIFRTSAKVNCSDSCGIVGKRSNGQTLSYASDNIELL